MESKKNNINRYFVGGEADNALEEYKNFTQKMGWSIDHKIDLYLAGDVAFNPVEDMGKRFNSFNEIYTSLRRYWQVFRNASSYWESQKVFDVLTEDCCVCSRNSNLSLINLDEEKNQMIAECLMKIKDIKTLSSGETSSMAISKFLHFFNPKLFPIYDNQIIKKEVLKTFSDDWSSFKDDICTKNIDKGIETYFCYVLWASNIFKQSQNGVMNKFIKIFAKRIEGNPLELPRDLTEYYATAFEFISIGASELVKNDNKREN